MKRQKMAAAALALAFALAAAWTVFAAPVRVIFDTDMFGDYDDVGAMAVLHALADAGECEILGTVVSTRGTPAAGMVEILNRHYGRAGLPLGVNRELGVAAKGGEEFGAGKLYRKIVESRPGETAYPDSAAAPDAVGVYRRLLAAQPDNSVTVCSVGFATNLRRLLESGPDANSPLSGKELAAKKVKAWYAMACKYPEGREYNAAEDWESTDICCREWPTPIYFLDFNYGFTVRCGVPASKISDPSSPVGEVYRAAVEFYRPVDPNGLPSWDQVATLAAVRGWERYFRTERGRFTIAPDGHNRWERRDDGNHFVLLEQTPKAEVGRIIDELMARPPRGRRTESGISARRITSKPRYSRGDTGQYVLSPIDTAAWIWHPDCVNDGSADPARFVRFEKKISTDGGTVTVDVSADERYVLTVDGQQVGRGPDRAASVENWQYATYEISMPPGEHVIAVVVSQMREMAPIAQLSWRGGFILKGRGKYDAELTTGKAEWRCGLLKGTVPARKFPKEAPWGGAGSEMTVSGAGWEHEIPAEWKKPVVVKPSLSGLMRQHIGGIRRPGWMLFPSQLPEQLRRRVVKPGSFRETSGTDGSVVAANTKARIVWDLENYWCAYPELLVNGGKGAKIVWRWNESLKDDNNRKGNRNEWRGKHFTSGIADTFLPDGRNGARFTVPWWRCGRWCEITVETGDEPLEIAELAIAETRYPLERTSYFRTPDDGSLDEVQRLCLRGMQMCAHEMLMDCPFYEQQMYPGDTRVQLLALTAIAGETPIIRRAIEMFDLARRDDGSVPMNWPTRNFQESTTYSLAHAIMYGDYVQWGGDRKWLEARFPGFMNTMHGFELQEDESGLLRDTWGWPFIDWCLGTKWRRMEKPADLGQGGNSAENMFYLLAIQSAERVCRALDKPELASYWRRKAERLGQAIMREYFDERSGLMADVTTKDLFSEHGLALSILTGLVKGEAAERAVKRLSEGTGLVKASVYFSHYVFEALGQTGHAEEILGKRLDLWREYVSLGLYTPLECPATPKDDTRSDCHAWGSHPIYHLLTKVAGIKSGGDFFKSVEISPNPGKLSQFSAGMPHRLGMIRADLRFDGGKVRGTVELPRRLEGVFRYSGLEIPLKGGINPVGGGLTDETTKGN